MESNHADIIKEIYIEEEGCFHITKEKGNENSVANIKGSKPTIMTLLMSGMEQLLNHNVATEQDLLKALTIVIDERRKRNESK